MYFYARLQIELKCTFKTRICRGTFVAWYFFGGNQLLVFLFSKEILERPRLAFMRKL